MGAKKNISLRDLEKKIINDLMQDDLTSDVIIAKARVLEVILKELRWND